MSEEERLLKEAKRLPCESRLFHKNWKVRTDANIDLATLFYSITDPTDPRLREFGPLFRKTVTDSNAPVQEKALDALIAFLSAADADARRYAKEVCDAIVVKCLTGRPKIIEKSQAVFLLWVELEATDVFLDAMERAIKNKVSKVVVVAIDVMFQALSEFGPNIVPPKRLLKILPDLFDHQDQNVRASAKGLTLELCRWIGQAPIKSILFEKMRDTTKKELEVELINVSGTARPSRRIRSEQKRELEEEDASEALGLGSCQVSLPDTPQVVDEYQLVDPVDILAPLEKSGFWKGVKSAKWSERKEAISELTKLASAKRISPGDFTDVCRTLKKLVTDVNVAVAVEAVHAIKNLASGLRNNFSGCSRLLLPILLEKLKEKKQVLTDSLTQTLKTMHQGGCLTIVDIVEDVKTSVKNKAPVVRALTLNWVTFCIETSKKDIILKSYKDYVPICIECLSDGTPDVRDASFSTLAAIAKVIGMKNLERSLEKLDEVKKKKLAELTASSGGGPLAGAPGSTENGKLLSREADKGASVKKSAASMLGGKKLCKPALVPRKDRGSVKQEKSKKRLDEGHAKKAVEAEDLEPADMNLEDIESSLASVLKPDTISGLKSDAWKDRLEAICSLKQQVEAIRKLDMITEMLIRLLCAVPGWRENNHQILQQVIEVVIYTSSTVTPFPKRCVVLCIQGICEKLAEIRTRPHALKCLTALSEAVGPGFIFERLYSTLKEHKNPKVLSEGILWMVSAVEDFGISYLDLKDLIDFCKKVGLQSTGVASRNATVKLLGALHKFIGPDIKNFLADVKPKLLSTLEMEFKMSPYEGASAVVKRTVRDPTAVVKRTARDSTAAVPSMGLDGVSRGNIIEKDTPKMLKNLRSSDRKVQVTKNRKDLQASSDLVSKQSKLYRAQQESSNSRKTIGINPTSKTSSNIKKYSAGSKANGDNLLKPGKRTVPSRVIPAKGSRSSAKGSKVEATSSFSNAFMNSHGINPTSKNSSNIKKGSAGSKANGDNLLKPGKRTVPSRVIPAKGSRSTTKVSKAEATSSFSNAFMNSHDLFNIKNSKKENRLRLVIHSYKFKKPGAEQIRGVEIDLKNFFIRDLHEHLLSADFKKQIYGLEILRKALASNQNEVIEVLDILLRWFILQFCKSNSTCLLKVLEFLLELFDMLKARCYTLFESEAAIILPFFIEKLGHNTEGVRKCIWNLIQNISFLYYPEKMFPYILEGLKSKNSRTRIGCVDFVGFLLDNHTSQIGGQLKSLKFISSMILDKDAETRKASLSTLATAYKYIGEEIWKYVGKLSAVEKSLLNDKFKWKAEEMEKVKEGKPGEARASLNNSGNVTQELVKMRGSAIKGDFSKVDKSVEPQPLILAEISFNHQTPDGQAHLSSPVHQNNQRGSDVFSTKSCSGGQLEKELLQ